MPRRKTLVWISFGLFIVFIFFSYLVAKERFTQFDFDTTVKVQDHLSRRFDFPFSVLSIIGSAEIMGIIWLCLVIFSIIKKFWKTALSLLLLPAALAIEIYGKLFVFHPGPPHLLYRGVIKFNLPSEYVPVDYSYPSGHVTRTAFIVMFLIGWWLLRQSFKKFLAPYILLVIFLLAMIISRIYLGEHWSTDVIGGLLIGSAFGLMAALTIPAKNSVEPSKLPHPSK